MRLFPMRQKDRKRLMRSVKRLSLVLGVCTGLSLLIAGGVLTYRNIIRQMGELPQMIEVYSLDTSRQKDVEQIAYRELKKAQRLGFNRFEFEDRLFEQLRQERWFQDARVKSYLKGKLVLTVTSIVPEYALREDNGTISFLSRSGYVVTRQLKKEEFCSSEARAPHLVFIQLAGGKVVFQPRESKNVYLKLGDSKADLNRVLRAARFVLHLAAKGVSKGACRYVRYDAGTGFTLVVQTHRGFASVLFGQTPGAAENDRFEKLVSKNLDWDRVVQVDLRLEKRAHLKFASVENTAGEMTP